MIHRHDGQRALPVGPFLLRALLFLAFSIKVSASLKIVDLQIPDDFDISSEKPLLLDCIYDIEESEGDPLVKWYYNGRIISQWIYPAPPKFSEHWKSVLDTKYASSNDSKKQYRGLMIPHPTVNLTGMYTCHVESWHDQVPQEDSQSKNVTFYVPAQNMNLSVAISPDEKEMEVICTAEGLKPQPEMKLTTNNQRLDVKNQTINIEDDDEDGDYDVTITWNLQMQDLMPSTTFNCSVSVPGTHYIRFETYKYKQSGYNDDEDDDDSDEDNDGSNGSICKINMMLVLSLIGYILLNHVLGRN